MTRILFPSFKLPKTYLLIVNLDLEKLACYKMQLNFELLPWLQSTPEQNHVYTPIHAHRILDEHRG